MPRLHTVFITEPAIGTGQFRREGVMHPMFVKLFIETDADDLLAYEEDKRRRARRVSNNKSRIVTRIAVRSGDEPRRRP